MEADERDFSSTMQFSPAVEGTLETANQPATPEKFVPSAASAAASSAPAPARPPRKRGGLRTARVFLALFFLLGFFFSVLPVGRAAVRAGVLLPAFLSASEPLPLAVAGEPIRHTSQTISSNNGPVYIDIYAPSGAPPLFSGSREAIVDIPGVGDNRTDPQLINFSESMARTGIIVVNLTTPTLINFDLSPADSDAVVQTFKLALRQPGVDPQRVGIIGFSGGTVLACIAAADPRISAQVAFVTLFGTAFNIADVLRDYGRQAVVADGQTTHFKPYATAVKVFSDVFADTLPYADAQTMLGAFAPGAAPLSDPETAFTSPGAADAYHLLAGDDPAHVDQHLAGLSPAMQTLLQQLSPSNYLAHIRAPIYLLHDHNDPSIPFTESRDFDAALTRLGHAHDFAEFGIFNHTEISSGFGLIPALVDGSKLYRILFQVLLAHS
jgi:acetyl esterase/lipase